MQKNYDTGENIEDINLVCSKCNEKMVLKSVKLEYMGTSFPVELPSCPTCNQVYISEGLATGKIFKVEQSLEDK